MRPLSHGVNIAEAVSHFAPDTVSRYVITVDSSTVVTIPSYPIEKLLPPIEVASGHDHHWSPPTSR